MQSVKPTSKLVCVYLYIRWPRGSIISCTGLFYLFLIEGNQNIQKSEVGHFSSSVQAFPLALTDQRTWQHQTIQTEKSRSFRVALARYHEQFLSS